MQKSGSFEPIQTVEKVQFSLGFFCVLWYNKVGDKNDSKRQNT